MLKSMPLSALTSERITQLVDQAFADLADPATPLSVGAAKAKRIARLRNDFDNLHWLEFELRSYGSDFAKSEIALEIAGHYSAEEAATRSEQVIDLYMEERTVEFPAAEGEDAEKKFLPFSIRELEDREQQVADVRSGLAPGTRSQVQVITATTRMTAAIRQVLGRVEHRVHDFLSATEQQLLYGQVNADIFERNRRYVDGELAGISPRAFEQISAAYRRAGEGDEEARSQALLSCRRALKSVADVLCPATDEVAVDDDGTGHRLTDDKWRNRLTEFAKKKLSGHAAGDLLKTQLDDLARRFTGISEAGSRGVHADVTEFELNQTVIQTYLTIGDLLRIRADDSGLIIVAQGFTAEAQ